MPSFRKPRGVRVLVSGEWFYADQASASGFSNPGAGHDAQVAIFNDSQIGEWLWIYGLQLESFAAQIAYYYAIQGTIGTLSGTAFPTVCDAPVPRGQIFLGTAPNFVPGPGLSIPFIQLFSPSAQAAPLGPLAIIKPGYSLVAQANEDLQCSFQYLVMGN